MKKLSVLMAAALVGGAAGSLLADTLNPQPLPPGAAQSAKGGPKITKHKPSPGTSSFKTRRLLPKTHISTDGGKTGKNLTLHDSKQLIGNLKGGKNNPNNSMNKDSFIKFKGAQGMQKAAPGGAGGQGGLGETSAH